MLRVLLVGINSSYIHNTPAVYTLRRAAEQVGCGDMVSTAQFSINMAQPAVLDAIYQQKPDIICFSVYIWNAAYLAPLIADLRLLLPSVMIWLGGPEASARPRYYLQQLTADAVCIGEGEDCFAQMMQLAQNAEADWQEALNESVNGWMWRGREDEYRPAVPPDLARLPFFYTTEEGAQLAAEHKVVYYESSRGCPYRCSFCSSAREKLRERPLELVLDELPLLAEIGGQIKFIDRTMNADTKRAGIIISRVLELYRPGLSWHFELSPFLLTDTLCEMLISAPADYLHLEIGVQTLHRPALAAVGRHGEWSQAEPKVKRLIASGCHVHLDLIAGLPEDTPQTFADSFHRLHQLNADYLQFGFLKVLPGSLLAEDAGRLGLVFSPQPPYRILATPNFSAEELFRLTRAERAFNTLYNKAREFRPQLLAKAEDYPGGALAMYHAAAGIMPQGGLNTRARQTLIEQI